MVSSDNSVYAQLTKLVGPKAIVKTAHALGIRSELDPYFSIGLGAVAVNPLDMTRAYATFANRGRPCRRLADRRPAPGDREGRVRAQRPRLGEPPPGASDDDDGAGRPSHLDPATRRHAGHRQARGARRPARRRQDGHDRQLRRRLVRRLHASARRRGLGRLSRPAEADADRIRRQAGRRRHAPGADLEGVHDERPTKELKIEPGAVPGDAVSAGPGEANRVAPGLVQARQRLLPRHTGRRLLRRAAGRRRRQSATRTR